MTLRNKSVYYTDFVRLDNTQKNAEPIYTKDETIATHRINEPFSFTKFQTFIDQLN